MRHVSMMVCAVAMAGAALPAQAQDSTFVSSSLSGRNVPDGGDDEATGNFNGEAFPGDGRLCYYLDMFDIRNPTGVTLNRGAEGEAGVVVATLELPGADGDEVCVSVDPAVLQDIAGDPAAFYIVVTSRRNEGGAMRGQLTE